jgi:hypothetical protein
MADFKFLFWKKRLPRIAPGEYTVLESSLINATIDAIPAPYREKLEALKIHVKSFRRIDYKTYIVTELHTASLVSARERFAFGRTEEFRLSTIKLQVNGHKFTAHLEMVLGLLFEIKITPVPPKELIITKEAITISSIKVDGNLDRNTLV